MNIPKHSKLFSATYALHFETFMLIIYKSFLPIAYLAEYLGITGIRTSH